MALLDPTTPEGRLLMFKKDILPGRIEYAERCKNDVNAQDAQDKVTEVREEIARLEKVIAARAIVKEKNPGEKLEAVWNDLFAIRKKHTPGSMEYFVLLTFLDQTQMMIEQYKQGRKDGYENGE